MGKPVLILLLICCVPFARANNLVTNPGFETGDFTGWTLSGTDSSTCSSSNSQYCGVDNLNPHSGTYEAYFGPVGGVLQLAQSLTTTAGTAYDISFWLSQDTQPTTNYPNSFAFSWGAASLAGTTEVATTNGYTEYAFSDISATSNSTNLVFSFRNDLGYFDLDDVSVTPIAAAAVPEPTTVGFSLASGALLGFLGLRRWALGSK